MLQDVKEKVIQFGVSSPTLLGVTGNLQRCGHFQPPPIPDRVNRDYMLLTYLPTYTKYNISCFCQLLHDKMHHFDNVFERGRHKVDKQQVWKLVLKAFKNMSGYMKDCWFWAVA